MPASASARFLRSRSEKRLARTLALQVISGCRKFQLEGCRPRHPRGFFDPDRRNGSRGRSPSSFFLAVANFNWRDAGLGIRAVSSIQIGETAREAARPPGVLLGCRKVQLEGCRTRHPRGFFDRNRRNGSRGRSPSRCFIRLPQSPIGGMPNSASAGVLQFRSEKRLARPLALQVFY